MPRKIVDTEGYAKSLRETFTAKPLRRGAYDLGCRWPEKVRHVGTSEAVMYTSDKWVEDGAFEDYKHISESHQDLFIVPSLAPRGISAWHGPVLDLDGPLPHHVAELAPCLGIQARLFSGIDGEEGVFPSGKDDGYYTISLPNGVLYGAKHPGTGLAFLFVASPREGVLVLITGDELDVTRDGIVG